MIDKYILKTSSFFFILLPFFLVFSFFLADLSIVICSLSYIFLKIKYKDFYKFEKIILVLIIIYWVYLLLLSAFSIDPLLSFESSLFYIRFGLFALFLPIIFNQYPKVLFYFYISLLSVFFLLIVDSLVILLLDKNIFGVDVLADGTFGQRISSFFYSEQILGSYLSRMLPILLFLIIVYEKNNRKFFYLLSFVLVFSSLVIFISGERTSIIYLLLIFISFFIFSKNILKIFLLSFSIFVFLSVLTLQLHSGVKKRVIDYTIFQYEDLIQNSDLKNPVNVVNDDRYSYILSIINSLPLFTTQHKALYNTSFKIFLDNYLFGIGPKIFRIECKKDEYKTLVLIDPSIDGCQSHPHNTYFQLFVETGIIGTLPIMVIFIFILYLLCSKLFTRFSLRERDKYDLNLCLYISFLITLWPFLPTGNFFHNWLNIIYYLPIGFFLKINFINKKIND